MKGVIADCASKLVTEKFGADKWEKILESAGLPRSAVFLASQNVDEEKFLKVVESICQVLGLTLAQVADAFGDYWVNVYSQKIYSSYYKSCKSAKEFLLKMDGIHVKTTAALKDSRPPRFTYEWEDDNRLVMGYQSERGLIDFMIGLIKGVGAHYKEPLQVQKLSSKKVRVIFGA